MTGMLACIENIFSSYTYATLSHSQTASAICQQTEVFLRQLLVCICIKLVQKLFHKRDLQS